MLEKWKNTVKKIFVRDEDYNYVFEDICENNRRILVILCSVFTMIFAFLLLLGFLKIGIEAEDMPVFIVAFLCVVCLLIFVLRVAKQNCVATMVSTYVLIIAALAYGLLVSYRSPEQYTVTFIALISIISMTFVDKPGRLTTVNAIGAIVCVGMISVRKEEAIRAGDIVNVASYSVLSFVGCYFTVKMKIHSYVLEHLQKQNIEKSMERLNAKEFEAAQLLTAIKATYAMVVSVNLTQNTYKLVGEESFVTQGDALDGNFDEVINVHASKVVEEQRQLYYDTFSRQALLNAYAEGKKAVYLEYQQKGEDGIPRWLGTHTMFTTEPGSTDVTEVTISQNVDDRVRKEEESKAILEAERDRAEQAQKAKTDFLFQMSHDIRTPMNAIIGYANFIKSSDDLYVIHNDYILKLEMAGQQLLMLINDALEMSHIESGKLMFRRELQDIRTVILNVMGVMQIQAEEKGLQLVSDVHVENPFVYCDQNHMSRIIMNLVSNAVKFTPAGGEVRVSLYEQEDSQEGYSTFELKVSDTGIGMSPEFLSKVFEPFEREQTSTVSGMQGTGLGLAIVKRIVDNAGDTIFVESKQGEGTVFTLYLTKRRGEMTASQEYSEQDPEVPTVEKMTDYFKGKRVLLVEDNEFNLAIAQTLLERAGFTVETATDGRMAVNKVAGAPTPGYYDAILMDVQMPVLNGYEATKEIRLLRDDRANTPIIAVTANAFDTDRDDAIAAGMNGHLAKPIDVTSLYRMLWGIIQEK